MMTLLDMERMKLFSTRAVWWCIGLATLGTAGLSLSIAAEADPRGVTVLETQLGAATSQLVFMIMAVVAVTGEYRFGTIRVTHLAAPRRWQVFVAKAATLGGLSGSLGLLYAFGGLALVALLTPEADLALTAGAQWRQVAGNGGVCLVSVVLAVAVGTLLRHAAGAISVLLSWLLVVEPVVGVLPGGEALTPLLPFQAMAYFLGQATFEAPYPPAFGLAYAAAVAVALSFVTIFVIERRDGG